MSGWVAALIVVTYPLWLWFAFTGWVKGRYGPQWRAVSIAAGLAAAAWQAMVLWVVHSALSHPEAAVLTSSLHHLLFWLAGTVLWAAPAWWLWLDVLVRLGPAWGFAVAYSLCWFGAVGAAVWYLMRGSITDLLSPGESSSSHAAAGGVGS